jgi:hypothetical protein
VKPAHQPIPAALRPDHKSDERVDGKDLPGGVVDSSAEQSSAEQSDQPETAPAS